MIMKKSQTISLSDGLLDDLGSFTIKKRHVLHNGISLLAAPTISHSGDGKVRLLFFSNLVRSKGLAELIEALHTLHASMGESNWIMRIAGNRGDISPADVETLTTKLQLKGMVEYVGPKYGEEKHETFAWAQLLVFPTYNDTFPLVVLEAMRASLGVISTHEGAIPEMIIQDKGGLLVRQHDIEGLSKAIQFAVTHPEDLINWGRHNRKRFEEHYTEEQFIRNLHKVLTEALSI